MIYLLNVMRKGALLCVYAVFSVVPCGIALAQAVEPVVSVVFAGDIMLEGGPDRAIRRGQDPFAGVAHVFKGADGVTAAPKPSRKCWACFKNQAWAITAVASI